MVADDGKVMRGTIPSGESQGVQLLAAYLPAEGLVLMQVVVGNKEGELTAAPRLLETLDLRSAQATNSGHGPLERRTLTVSAFLNGYSDWLKS